ncbi:hypothetical protein KHA96_10580 [Bacillus sp. FJAT-49711]|uniref:hypothetical protein n=1 Tax=Bacillus sp. FJAT-49711 TaxID=2833585 RepID=UPI001BC8DDC7|nr:hypothetical protein [Bacillus sp. FJAT-49711]MBS4218758.1 hypothetical protein [Bacillus sp. FJAT-49711]
MGKRINGTTQLEGESRLSYKRALKKSLTFYCVKYLAVDFRSRWLRFPGHRKAEGVCS